MLPYITGFSHAAIIACLLFLFHPAMREDRNQPPAPDYKPYALIIQDDCYMPHGGVENEIRLLTVQDVERIYE